MLPIKNIIFDSLIEANIPYDTYQQPIQLNNTSMDSSHDCEINNRATTFGERFRLGMEK